MRGVQRPVRSEAGAADEPDHEDVGTTKEFSFPTKERRRRSIGDCGGESNMRLNRRQKAGGLNSSVGGKARTALDRWQGNG